MITLLFDIPYNLVTLMGTWIINDVCSKVWDEITFPFPNFNGATSILRL